MTEKRATALLLIALLFGIVAAAPVVIDRTAASATTTAVRTGFAPDQPARILLFGDSLSSESESPFVAAITRTGRAEVRTGVWGGTAPCDWLDDMAAAAAWQPDAVVFEFSGNALTPCMAGAVGDAYWSRYEADTEAALATFPEARFYLVGTPVSRSSATTRDPDAGRLNAIYATLAGTHPGVQFVPAHQSLLFRGQFTETLPCLTAEPCAGATSLPGRSVNVVRAPDGVHFCPEPVAPAVNGVTTVCPVWSSGAYRFGTAMAGPVVADLGL